MNPIQLDLNILRANLVEPERVVAGWSIVIPFVVISGREEPNNRAQGDSAAFTAK